MVGGAHRPSCSLSKYPSSWFPAGWQELQMQAGECIQSLGSATWVRLL